MTHVVLFVDDEPNVTEALKRALRKEPYTVLSAGSAEEALRILSREPVDVVVTDERMPGMPGSELLAVVCRQYPDTVRIILTGHASLQAALVAINKGEIYRFLTKPINELELTVTIRQAIQHKDLMSESRRLLKTFKQQHALLRELERKNPGITTVVRDASGAIILDEEDYDTDDLVTEMNNEVKRWENLFAGRSKT
jgi:two-component system probable response regulator PhcQ